MHISLDSYKLSALTSLRHPSLISVLRKTNNYKLLIYKVYVSVIILGHVYLL